MIFRYGLIIFTSIILISMYFLGSYLYNEEKKLANVVKDPSILTRDYSKVLGGKEAKVTIVEFLDPACGTCRAFSPVLKKVLEAYPKKIKLVIRYAPFHQGSDYVIKVLEASRRQGKYQETLEAMFNSQPEWASHHDPQPQKIWNHINKVGLDLELLRKDMNDPKIEKNLLQDIKDGKTLKVTKTPEFFVNANRLQNFGYKQLFELIAAELKNHYDKK